MNDTTSPPFLAQPWALRLAFALLVGLTIIVGLAFADRSARHQLESVIETTAVGDTAYLSLTKATKLPFVGASLQGQPLHVLSAAAIEVRDTHTRFLARDPGTGLGIYQLSPAATDEERDRAEKGRKAYLLKVAPNEYVKGQLAPP